MDVPIAYALKAIKAQRSRLSSQQMKTLKGQVLAGDVSGAMKGLKALTEGRSACCPRREDAHNGGGQTAQQGSSQQYTGGSSSDGFTQVDDDELPF